MEFRISPGEASYFPGGGVPIFPGRRPGRSPIKYSTGLSARSGRKITKPGSVKYSQASEKRNAWREMKTIERPKQRQIPKETQGCVRESQFSEKRKGG